MPPGNYRAEINPGRVGPWSGDLSNQHRPTLPGLANRVAETGGMCPRLFMENHSVVYSHAEERSSGEWPKKGQFIQVSAIVTNG